MPGMAARGRRDDEGEREAAGEDAAPEKPRRARTAEPEKETGAHGVLGALSSGLDEIVPGIEILDKELVLEGGGRADLAGVDPSGRLYFVLLAGEDSDRAALEALDALAYLRRHVELLVRHFGERRVDPERAPRVLIVSPTADPRLSERLAALSDAGVTVLGLSTVKSAAGERSYLVRCEPRGRNGPSATGMAAFLRALPARLEPLGHGLVERMSRLDEELEPSADGTTIVWRLQGEVLCRVERVGDVLQASVAPRHEPLALAETADLERLVEQALARLVRVLGMTREQKTTPGSPVLTGDREEPLLTPEEIQAFRE